MEVNSLSISYQKNNQVAVIKDHLFLLVNEIAYGSEEITYFIKSEIVNLYKGNKIKEKSFAKRMNIISHKLMRFLKKNHIKEIPLYSINLCYIDVCDVHVFSIGDNASYIHKKDERDSFLFDKSRGDSKYFYPQLKEKIKVKHLKFDINQLYNVFLVNNEYYSAFYEHRLFKNRRRLFHPYLDLQEVSFLLKGFKKNNITAIKVTF